MDRREFLNVSSALVMSALIPSGGISAMEPLYPDVTVPEFSSANLHNLLDALVDAYESKGLRVGDSLLPPLSKAELERRCRWFPGKLPQEIVSLYAWRGGQANEAWDEDFPFWFRDNSFCSIDRAEREYKSMMKFYGIYPEDHELLKFSFPFASFNGGWYVLPTSGQPYSPNLSAPIVSVLQGIDIYFFSMEQMVRTCIDWVSHEKYKEGHSMPEDIEMEIWAKHNPGIFGYGA